MLVANLELVFSRPKLPRDFNRLVGFFLDNCALKFTIILLRLFVIYIDDAVVLFAARRPNC